jgi:putative salt-induced outer membrane protein YdiY
MSRCNPFALAAALLLPAFAQAQAQATVKPDGQWRYALGAAASLARGNTSSTNVNLSGDAVNMTSFSKWDIAARSQYAKSDGATTANNYDLATQYNRDVTPQWFGFGRASFLRDQPANVSSRWSTFGGVGNHVVRTDANTWDVSAGLGYTRDRYVSPALTDNGLQESYGHFEALLAEESSHQLTGNTSLKQKLSVFPDLRQRGNYRAVFDTGLSVAMNATMSLTAGLNYRYNSDPGVGVKKGDALFVTGISVKID